MTKADPGNRERNRSWIAAAAVVGHLLAAGCTTFASSGRAVSFTTDPPGARVIIDRKDTGFVTPCRLAMPGEDRHHVDLVMPGYSPVHLRVKRGRNADVILWRDMYVRPVVWRFPLWLNLEDSFEPFKFRRSYSPGHVFVRLERAGER
jgi:hypothetical protein